MLVVFSFSIFCICMFLIFFCFFFSSRRRHTRYIGDWSSDVCSSDLGRSRGQHGESSGGRGARAEGGGERRSEERRVGKEGRNGGGAECLKKKERKRKRGRGQQNSENSEQVQVDVENQRRETNNRRWK